jgi:hypothetical protein
MMPHWQVSRGGTSDSESDSRGLPGPGPARRSPPQMPVNPVQYYAEHSKLLATGHYSISEGRAAAQAAVAT